MTTVVYATPAGIYKVDGPDEATTRRVIELLAEPVLVDGAWEDTSHLIPLAPRVDRTFIWRRLEQPEVFDGFGPRI